MPLSPGNADKPSLPTQAHDLIQSLKRLLDASFVLYDAGKHTHHFATPARDWFSLQSTSTSFVARKGDLHARINDRWTLYICPRRTLHYDAESLAVWAAGQLAPHLPGRAAGYRMMYARGTTETDSKTPTTVPLSLAAWRARRATP